MFTYCLDLTFIFTDDDDGSVGCAFILSGEAFKLNLNSFNSVFNAQLLALSKALEAEGNLLPGSFYCVQTPRAQSKAYSPLFSPTHSSWSYA
jgi:hypothetical protein